MTTSFAARKFTWIDRIIRDRNVPHLAARVAVLISNYLNRTSGDAWPSQGKLAADLGVARRTIQYALDALVGTGHLAVEVSRGKTNHYRPIFETEDAQSGAQVDAQSGAQVEQADAQSDATDLRNLTTGTYARPFAQNTIEDNPIKNNPKRKSLAMISESTSSGFEEFWRVFPRKVAKLKAEKAYASIIKSKRASADERTGEDPKFTKHPPTWLTGGCWTDEPKAPTSFAKPSRADSAIAGMRGFLEDGHHGD
jgi:DNA-binding transcriptional regulator YhcF (GntR family)